MSPLVPGLGQQINVLADAGEGALQRLRGRLQGADAVVALVMKLGEADQLHIHHAGLELADALLELASPVVGDGRGRVLHGAEVLQGRDPRVDGGVLLALLGFRVGEALLPLGVEVVEPLQQLVEHGAGVGLHDALGTLEVGEVGMGGRCRIQRSLGPGNGGSDSRLLAPSMPGTNGDEEEGVLLVISSSAEYGLQEISK